MTATIVAVVYVVTTSVAVRLLLASLGVFAKALGAVRLPPVGKKPAKKK